MKQEYKIFRLTSEGYLKDIAFKSYPHYLQAEKVVNTLKRENKKKKYIIFKIY